MASPAFAQAGAAGGGPGGASAGAGAQVVNAGLAGALVPDWLMDAAAGFMDPGALAVLGT
jgi:hypothetical protein